MFYDTAAFSMCLKKTGDFIEEGLLFSFVEKEKYRGDNQNQNITETILRVTSWQ